MIKSSLDKNPEIFDEYSCQWGDGTAEYSDEDTLYFTNITAHGTYKISIQCLTKEAKEKRRLEQEERDRKWEEGRKAYPPRPPRDEDPPQDPANPEGYDNGNDDKFGWTFDRNGRWQ